MENNYDIVIGFLQNEFSHIKNIAAVYLYGSVARGDFSARHSDMDIVVFLKKRTRALEENINKKIIPLGLKYGVKIHAEYIGKIKEEDRSLLRKILEEGKQIYAADSFFIEGKNLGLRQFLIYSYSLVGNARKSHFSKIMHGRKSWYFNKGKKIIKQYNGIIDNKDIFEAGRGAIMVAKERQKDVLRLFQEYKVEFVLKKIVYG